MKKFILSFSLLLSGVAMIQAQEQLPNAGFENWTDSYPDNYFDNKAGNATAQLGPHTASQSSDAHSGNSSVLIETKSIVIAVVNGNLTSGYVNAPSTDKAEGFIGTWNYDDNSQVRRLDFTSRPDSLVGWFKYTPANDAGEKAHIRVVLHKGQFFDPETPVSGNHPDSSMNRIGAALFESEHQTYSTWTRFSVPFEYVSQENPQYILVNITSSANQMTTVAGSKLWLDDLQLIYNSTSTKETNAPEFNVYSKNHSVVVDLSSVEIHNGVLNILDLSGRKIASSKLTSNQMNTIALPSDTQSGIYIYQIESNDFSKSGKIAF